MSPMVLLQFGLAVVTIVIGAVIWFVRLEGRVNLLDRVLSDHLQDSKMIFSDVRSALVRVESKMDRLALRCVAWQHHHVPARDDAPTQEEGGA